MRECNLFYAPRNKLADEVAMLVYRVEPKVIETEKVLNGLIRALRDNSEPSAFSLQPKHLRSYVR